MATFTDIDLSFRKHPVSKDIIKKTDVDAVKQSLRNLFMTNPMRDLLFEPLSPPLIGIIQRKIGEQLLEYEPRCVVDSIDVSEDSDNGLSISLAFHVSGNIAQQSFNFVLERTR
jgi:phage baseplate assembly protein W